MSARGDRGQATVELALALPLLAVVILVVLQLVVVMRDAVALTTAARAAARQAMVDPAPSAVRAAAVRETGLSPDRLTVAVSGDTAPGGFVTVVVRYRAPTDLAVVGAFAPDVVLTERFVVLRE